MRAVLVAVVCLGCCLVCRATLSRLRSHTALASYGEARRSAGGPKAAGSPDVAPRDFLVRLDTSKGPIVIEVRREWGPNGADRFHELVTSRYFDDSRFFRVVKGQWAQFGIHGDPSVSTRWRTRTIPDDPPRQSNVRGTVTFAFAEPNGRTTQVYIALKDLSDPQDAQGFVPFGRVIEGMEIADRLNAEYGESAGSGIRAGKQQPLFDGGNAYLDREFPRLDRLLRAVLLPGGLSRPIKDHLPGGASLLHPNAAAALGTPGLAALLLPQLLPVFSVVAPCHPGAALRNLVLVRPRQATARK